MNDLTLPNTVSSETVVLPVASSVFLSSEDVTLSPLVSDTVGSIVCQAGDINDIQPVLQMLDRCLVQDETGLQMTIVDDVRSRLETMWKENKLDSDVKRKMHKLGNDINTVAISKVATVAEEFYTLLQAVLGDNSHLAFLSETSLAATPDVVEEVTVSSVVKAEDVTSEENLYSSVVTFNPHLAGKVPPSLENLPEISTQVSGSQCSLPQSTADKLDANPYLSVERATTFTVPKSELESYYNPSTDSRVPPLEDKIQPSADEVTAISALTEFCSTELIDSPNPGAEDVTAGFAETDNSNPATDKSMPDAAVRLLISTYPKCYKLKTPVTKKNEIWQQVSAVFKENGYSYTTAQLTNKWLTLERAFKCVVQQSMSKGSGLVAVTCNYQRELEEVIAQCPDIFPEIMSDARTRKRPNDGKESYGGAMNEDDMSSLAPSPIASSEEDDRRFGRKRAATEIYSSSSSAMSDWSNSSDTETNKQKKETTTVEQEIVLLRNSFKAFVEEEEKQKALHHAEKMELLREIISSPSPPKITRNGKPIDRRQLAALLYALF